MTLIHSRASTRKFARADCSARHNVPGSEFSVRFPLALRSATNGVAASPVAAEFPAARILVVDDNEHARESLAMIRARQAAGERPYGDHLYIALTVLTTGNGGSPAKISFP